MSGDPVLVGLDEVEVEDVLSLLETCLGPAAVERSAGFWHWKHRSGPFGPSPGIVALADGRPVAVRTFLRWRWRAGERSFEAVRAVDTATHPEWRRRGLFRRLTTRLVDRVEAEGAAFVFNTPNPTSRAGYLALGWRDLGRVPVLVRPLKPLRMLARTWPRRPAAAAPPPSLDPLPPIAALLADPATGAFLDRWSRREPRLHTPRSLDYLRWRYGEAPGLDYRALWSFDGRSGALAVVRPRRRRRLGEAVLAELLVSPDREGRRAAGRLVGRIARIPDLDHVAAVACPGTDERRVLLGRGFLPLGLGPRWIFRPLAGLPDDMDPTGSGLRGWRVSAGDLELF